MRRWWTAVEAGDAERVRALLARRWWRKAGDVNERGFEGWTPLHVAARAGRDEVVALLLAHGANVNGRGRDNWTALQRADSRHLLQIREALEHFARLVKQAMEARTTARTGSVQDLLLYAQRLPPRPQPFGS